MVGYLGGLVFAEVALVGDAQFTVSVGDDFSGIHLDPTLCAHGIHRVTRKRLMAIKEKAMKMIIAWSGSSCISSPPCGRSGLPSRCAVPCVGT